MRHFQQKRGVGVSRARSRAWMPGELACSAGRRPGAPARLPRRLPRPRPPGPRAVGPRFTSGRAASSSSSRSLAPDTASRCRRAIAFMTMSLIRFGMLEFFSRGGETRSPRYSRSRSAGARRVVGQHAGQHLIHRDAERVEVRREHRLALELLGRHVGRAADDRRAVRGDLEEARRAEVGDLDQPGLRHEHVRRTQVAVQHALACARDRPRCRSGRRSRARASGRAGLRAG